MKTHAKVLHGDAYFPLIEEQGPHRCQMFKNSPMEGSESARLMYLLSITAAEKSLRVGNAYFVPDDLVTETLIAAVRRGVEVEVLVPGAQAVAASTFDGQPVGIPIAAEERTGQGEFCAFVVFRASAPAIPSPQPPPPSIP